VDYNYDNDIKYDSIVGIEVDRNLYGISDRYMYDRYETDRYAIFFAENEIVESINYHKSTINGSKGLICRFSIHTNQRTHGSFASTSCPPENESRYINSTQSLLEYFESNTLPGNPRSPLPWIPEQFETIQTTNHMYDYGDYFADYYGETEANQTVLNTAIADVPAANDTLADIDGPLFTYLKSFRVLISFVAFFNCVIMGLMLYYVIKKCSTATAVPKPSNPTVQKQTLEDVQGQKLNFPDEL
jgi:hypothetical protein